MSESKKLDKVFVGPEVTETGERLALRVTDDNVTIGTISAVENDVLGDPTKDLLKLEGDPDTGVFDVLEEIYTAPKPATSGGRVSSRPATKAYTRGWDAVFGNKNKSAFN